MIAPRLLGIQPRSLLSPHDRFLIAESLALYGIQTSEIKLSQMESNRRYKIVSTDFHLASGNNGLIAANLHYPLQGNLLDPFPAE